MIFSCRDIRTLPRLCNSLSPWPAVTLNNKIFSRKSCWGCFWPWILRELEDGDDGKDNDDVVWKNDYRTLGQCDEDEDDDYDYDDYLSLIWSVSCAPDYRTKCPLNKGRAGITMCRAPSQKTSRISLQTSAWYKYRFQHGTPCTVVDVMVLFWNSGFFQFKLSTLRLGTRAKKAPETLVELLVW